MKQGQNQDAPTMCPAFLTNPSPPPEVTIIFTYDPIHLPQNTHS